ncbi:MAG: DUF1788 domain-containing protein [Romboutsia timonensis]|uniref:DUF1788 domain-containing protein n=1 Tax=Romboutsia timonensis TaxID=1776391 RepID=UPI002A75DEDF|nr:DUF1788 domain-containing protein [Romboutsia timonensis]MDY2881954.1 DUF1788 domain-containing protein [Romboutsia timonensis]
MKDIHERLSEIKGVITEEAFRTNKGLGNEIGFHIFDYEPQYEMLVRDYIINLKKQVERDYEDIKIKEFDLYDIMLEVLDERGYLQKNFQMEEKKGSEYVFKATEKTLRLTSQKEDNKIVQYIIDRTEDDDIVFLTGVGKVWPIIRSHTVLNNLHRALDHVPVVLFFPGTYDGGSLMLFDEIKDDNYYRAFQLVDKY